MPRYYIKAKTGTVANSNTDSDVYCTLIGTAQSSASRKLDDVNVNNFVTAGIDLFEFIDPVALDAGTLRAIDLKVGSDGWFAEWVEIRRDDTGTTWTFPINRFIDGQTVRFTPAPLYSYLVRVKTSDRTDAATDASTVTATLYGQQASASFQLASPSDDFARGKAEEFEVRSTVDLGEIHTLKLAASGSDDWHVEWAEVVRDPNGENITSGFFFNAWVGSSTTRTATRVVLKDYLVSTKTRHSSDASTDGAVQLDLIGLAGKQGFRLDTPGDNFQSGALDRFQIRRPDVGAITHIDVTGSTSWAFEWIEVRELVSGNVFSFSGYKPDGGILWAQNGATVRVPAVELHPYRIRVKTGVAPNAGTDMKVFVKLPGAFPPFASSVGFDARTRLDDPGTDDFRAEAENDFETRTLLPVTPDGHLEVSVTGSGEWFVDWIELQDLRSGENWAYPIGRMLRPSDGALRFATAEMYDYGISVKTGDAEHSDTDSPIYMTFVASNGQTDRFLLDKPSRDDFERGKTDTFSRRSVIAPSLLASIRLENRGSDLWRCNWVELREQNPVLAAKERRAWDFFVNRSFTKGEAPASFSPTPMREYRVLVCTGNDGMDGTVKLQLHGTLGSSVQTLLDRPGRNDFSAGSVDDFRMKTASDLGEIENITLRKENGGSWRVNWLEVRRAQDGKRWNFWLDRTLNSGACVLSELPPTENVNSFSVRVLTGNLDNAASDSGVSLTLTSSSGNEATFSLDRSGHDDRRKGKVDSYTFKQKGPVFGALASLELVLTGPGAWYVDWMEVEINGQLYPVYLYSWLKSDTKPRLTRQLNAPVPPPPDAAALDALVRKFGPLVYHHPDEQYRMCSVDWFLQRTVLVAPNGVRTPAAQLNTASGIPAQSQSYFLDLATPGDTSTWRGHPESAKAYARAKLLPGGFMDLQYWFFYAYNGPGTAAVKSLIGGATASEEPRISLQPLGSHMGDWEQVTMRVELATERLCAVYFSQHNYGQWVDHDTSGSELTLVPNVYLPGVKQVVVYSSRNGHASYPQKGMNADINVTQPPSIPSFWKAVTLYPQWNFKLRNDTESSAYSLDCSVHYQLLSADYLSTGSEPAWLEYKGRWGPLREQNLSDARLRELLKAAIVPVVVDSVILTLVLPAVGWYVALAATAAVATFVAAPGTLLQELDEIKELGLHPLYEAGGPTGPKTKRSWTRPD